MGRSTLDITRTSSTFSVLPYSSRSPVLAVLLEYLLLGTLFPIDRTALNYVVAFAVLVTFAVDDIATVVPRQTVRLLLSTVTACYLTLATLNFAEDANFKRTTIWTV